jgi:hypothetical protein
MSTLIAPQAKTIYFGPTGTVYISNAHREIAATDSGDIAGLQDQGCTLVSGTGDAARTTSPLFTTPSLGAAVADSITFDLAAGGPTLKRGSNGRCGTFVANGASAVTVSNTAIEATDAIIISLNTVGGTVGAVPAVKTLTPGTGFTVAGTASDTSTYNYAIIKNAA